MPDEPISEAPVYAQKFPCNSAVRVTAGKFMGPAEVHDFNPRQDLHLVCTDRGVKTWVETKHLAKR